MEPFEWLMLGVGLAIGSLFGARGKDMVRSAAKGYLVVEEKTKEWTAGMREDFRDAVEEARYEREQEINLHDEARYETLPMEERRRDREEAEAPKPRGRRPRNSQTAAAATTGTRARAGTTFTGTLTTAESGGPKSA
jgi:predicted phage gp36 major capsid-like protein